MLMTIAIVPLIFWGLGLLTSFTLGGLLHLLLVAAVIVIMVRLIQRLRHPMLQEPDSSINLD